MSKKVYIGGGKYCYTDNCSQHDMTEAGQLTIKANEAAVAGNVSDFLKYREAAAEVEKTTGEKSQTALVFPSFSPEAKTQEAPKPAPPRNIAPAPSGADQQKQQMLKSLMLNDIRSYKPSGEKNRNGESIVKFHKDIGFPFYFRKPAGKVPLRYTQHAIDEAKKDRYGNIPVLQEANFDEMEIIEVKYNQATGRVDRMLFRQNSGRDNICLVVSPGRGTWNVITTWFNREDDSHKTLNRSAYATPHSKEQIVEASRAKQAA